MIQFNYGFKQSPTLPAYDSGPHSEDDTFRLNNHVFHLRSYPLRSCDVISIRSSHSRACGRRASPDNPEKYGIAVMALIPSRLIIYQACMVQVYPTYSILSFGLRVSNQLQPLAIRFTVNRVPVLKCQKPFFHTVHPPHGLANQPWTPPRCCVARLGEDPVG